MVFCIIGFYYENEEKGMDKMARKTKYEIRTLKTETDDVNQYNALLRYAFQVTEQELAETGWRDDEIKQSKFPVLDRADVLGCFDGKTHFAVCGLSAQNEYIRYSLSDWICNKCLHLSGIFRTRYYEKTHGKEPDQYAA